MTARRIAAGALAALLLGAAASAYDPAWLGLLLLCGGLAALLWLVHDVDRDDPVAVEARQGIADIEALLEAHADLTRPRQIDERWES